MSGEAPDWLIPMTSVRASRSSAPYTDRIDGVARATGIPSWIPNRYWA